MKVIKVGETWKFFGGKLRTFVGEGPPCVNIGHCHARVVDDEGYWWCPQAMATDGTLEYVGEADRTEKAAGSLTTVHPQEAEGKQHRFDRYAGSKFGYVEAVPMCLDCGASVRMESPCSPRPGWREERERLIAEMTARHDENMRPEVQPPTRYDARVLMATPGLGSPSLICPVRGVRGRCEARGR